LNALHGAIVYRLSNSSHLILTASFRERLGVVKFERNHQAFSGCYTIWRSITMTHGLNNPLVFQIKRFWISLNPPSPLGWICVLTLTFGTVQITKNLIIRVLVMALYTIVLGYDNRKNGKCRLGQN
jgi:hypothetical protein